jgi:hypothetical protein
MSSHENNKCVCMYTILFSCMQGTAIQTDNIQWKCRYLHTQITPTNTMYRFHGFFWTLFGWWHSWRWRAKRTKKGLGCIAFPAWSNPDLRHPPSPVLSPSCVRLFARVLPFQLLSHLLIRSLSPSSSSLRFLFIHLLPWFVTSIRYLPSIDPGRRDSLQLHQPSYSRLASSSTIGV